MSKPTEVTPTPDGYTAAYLYLTNRPGEGIRNEFEQFATRLLTIEGGRVRER